MKVDDPDLDDAIAKVEFFLDCQVVETVEPDKAQCELAHLTVRDNRNLLLFRGLRLSPISEQTREF